MPRNPSRSARVPARVPLWIALVAGLVGWEARPLKAHPQESPRPRIQGEPGRPIVIVERSDHPRFERMARRIPGMDGRGALWLARAFEELRRTTLEAILQGGQGRGLDRRALEALLKEHPCGGLEAAEVEALVASTLKDLGLEGVSFSAGFQVWVGGRPTSGTGVGPGKGDAPKGARKRPPAPADPPPERPRSGTATLEAHGATRGGNNYVQATFNFWFGTRDDARLTLNRWDVKLLEKSGTPMLDLARHRETPSRMADLGEVRWEDLERVFPLDLLMGDATAGRWEAVVGHTYLLHVVDREHVYWAALRVTDLDPKAHTVTFDWRRLGG